MARYYHPEHGVFTSIDPDPGDDDDPLTMNGYAYADNNPVMNIDPDGHWVWLVVGGVHSAYNDYKTYKKTKSWKKAGWSAAKTGLSYALPGPGSAFKYAGRGLKIIRSMKISKPVIRYASKISKRIPRQVNISKKWGVGLPSRRNGRIVSVYNRTRKVTKKSDPRKFGLDYHAFKGTNKTKKVHWHWNYTKGHRTFKNPKGR